MLERRGELKKQLQSRDLSKHRNISFIALVLLELPVGYFFLFSLIRGGSQFLSTVILLLMETGGFSKS